jgi:hypothetical protein
MLILEIALGIVLAVLILRYLPQILDLAVSVVVLSLLLGVIAGGIALVISFPQLLYLAAIFIGIAVLLVLADHANRYIQTNYERLPPWVKSSLKCVKEIKWALVLFSSLWAILTSIAVFIGTAWVLDSAKLLDSFPSWGWNIFGIVVPVGLTWLIYRLPWPAKRA